MANVTGAGVPGNPEFAVARIRIHVHVAARIVEPDQAAVGPVGQIVAGIDAGDGGTGR